MTVLPGVPQYWLGCNRFHHGAQSVGDVSGRYFVIRIQQDNGPKVRQCGRFNWLGLAQDHSMLMMRGHFLSMNIWFIIAPMSPWIVTQFALKNSNPIPSLPGVLFTDHCVLSFTHNFLVSIPHFCTHTNSTINQTTQVTSFHSLQAGWHCFPAQPRRSTTWSGRSSNQRPSDL